MADYGGFNIPSPQEVLARIQAQRDQFRQSSDPAVRRQAVFDTALDALFGNPQITAAQKITEALNTAQRGVQPVAGEDDLDGELRRLRAMRDRVENIDPAVAAQINQRMLVVGAERLERQKLLADMAYKSAENTRAESKEAREAGMYPTELAAKQVEIENKLSETQNYTNPRTGEIVNVNALDALQIKQLQKAGWVKSGVNIQVDDPAKLGAPSKATQNDLQKSLVESQSQLDMLRNSITKYRPEFLQMPSQVSNFGRRWAEKAGITLSPQEAAKLDAYSEFRATSIDAFNRYIKFITGAQMSQKEAERIQKAFPDAENDGPTQFLAKMRSVVKQTIGVQKRAQQALANGLQITGDQWEAVQMPAVSDSEVEAFMESLGVPKPGQKQTDNAKARQDRINQILQSK